LFVDVNRLDFTVAKSGPVMQSLDELQIATGAEPLRLL
jgi:hypothetical protein